MRYVVLFLLITLVPFVAMADGAPIDNRYYVTDEMWATEPYNKFVYLETFEGSCSAQYIAPNLILTAGHCVSGPKATAENYKKDKIKLQLVYNRHKAEDFGTEDWAVYLVKKSKYYSDSYFEPEKITQQTDLLHAGWGWLRILTNDEINTIYELLKSKTAKKAEIMTIPEIQKALQTELKNQGIEQFRDTKNRLKASRCHSVECNRDELRKYEDKLYDLFIAWEKCDNEREKAKTLQERQNWCKDEYEKYEACFKEVKRLRSSCERSYSNVIAHTCTVWEGDSGGGFVSEDNKLYGVCSFHSGGGFSPVRYMASSWQFEEKIKKLRDIYSISNSDKENVKKATKNTERVQKLLKSGVKLEDLDMYDIKTKPSETINDVIEEAEKEEESDEEKFTSQELKEHIEILHKEILQHESDVSAQIKELDHLGKSGTLQLLNDMVAYEVKSERLEELQKAYEEAKTREQSLANRTLTAATIAATGIGGMELAQGLAEQKVDKDAEQDMDAYMATFQCKIGNKKYPGGTKSIETSSENKLLQLYQEYIDLAADLKERKEALGMKPGIESEVILDSGTTGLYEGKGTGIQNGTYGSLYRAKMGIETDQVKINEKEDTSSKRVKGGSVAVGVGTVGGVVGNQLINSKANK